MFQAPVWYTVPLSLHHPTKAFDITNGASDWMSYYIYTHIISVYTYNMYQRTHSLNFSLSLSICAIVVNQKDGPQYHHAWVVKKKKNNLQMAVVYGISLIPHSTPTFLTYKNPLAFNEN